MPSHDAFRNQLPQLGRYKLVPEPTANRNCCCWRYVDGKRGRTSFFCWWCCSCTPSPYATDTTTCCCWRFFCCGHVGPYFTTGNTANLNCIITLERRLKAVQRCQHRLKVMRKEGRKEGRSKEFFRRNRRVLCLSFRRSNRTPTACSTLVYATPLEAYQRGAIRVHMFRFFFRCAFLVPVLISVGTTKRLLQSLFVASRSLHHHRLQSECPTRTAARSSLSPPAQLSTGTAFEHA